MILCRGRAPRRCRLTGFAINVWAVAERATVFNRPLPPSLPPRVIVVAREILAGWESADGPWTFNDTCRELRFFLRIDSFSFYIYIYINSLFIFVYGINYFKLNLNLFHHFPFIHIDNKIDESSTDNSFILISFNFFIYKSKCFATTIFSRWSSMVLRVNR